MGRNKTVGIITVISLLFSGGCSTNSHHASFRKIEPQEEISIILKGSSGVDLSVYDKDEGIKQGLLTGAREGAAAGVAHGVGTSIIVCGPAILFCLPVLAVGSALGGAAAHSVAGSVRGLPPEKAETFRLLLKKRIADFNVGDAFYQHYIEMAGQYWRLATSAPTRLYLQVEALNFSQHKNEQIRFNLSASLTARYRQNATDDSSKRLLFQYTSDPITVDDWLADDGEMFTIQATAGREKIVRQMISTMQNPPILRVPHHSPEKPVINDFDPLRAGSY